MILKVTDSSEDYGINVYKIALADLADKSRHPFIATEQWDAIYIDLNDNTPRGIIRQLMQRAKVVPIFDKNEITPRVMQLLSEIVPDSAAILRSTYQKNREEFMSVIESLSLNYGW